MVSGYPTAYPEVNEVLDLLLSHVREILASQFIGMYFYGSLSSGDFDPGGSDIDFLVVTTEMPSSETIGELESMHDRLWASGLEWASKLEGAYIPKDALRRYEPSAMKYPTINEARFYVDAHGSDWVIQRYIVREHGVVLAGPHPKSLIDPISPAEIRDAVLGILNDWWFPMLDDPPWLSRHSAEYHAYAILTMCRALHALQHGTIVSKPAAAKWAQAELGEPWSQVIERSLAQRLGRGQGGLLHDSLDLIRYTRDRVGILKNEDVK
jgi:predicted nucleotidyltransferase